MLLSKWEAAQISPPVRAEKSILLYPLITQSIGPSGMFHAAASTAVLAISNVLEISTIERIWSIICIQKSALLGLHIEKLNSEVELHNNQLSSNLEYEKYRALDVSAQERYFQLMQENKKKYNMAYNLKVAEFKTAMPEEIRLQYAELISNVFKFEGVVDKLFKRKRYLDCLCKIESGEKDYKVVNYDAMYNRD